MVKIIWANYTCTFSKWILSQTVNFTYSYLWSYFLWNILTVCILLEHYWFPISHNILCPKCRCCKALLYLQFQCKNRLISMSHVYILRKRIIIIYIIKLLCCHCNQAIIITHKPLVLQTTCFKQIISFSLQKITLKF